MADLPTTLYRRITTYEDGGSATVDSFHEAVWHDWMDDLTEWERAPGVVKVELYSAQIDWGRDLAPLVSQLTERFRPKATDDA